MFMIKDFMDGDSIQAELLVTNVNKGVNANGSHFLSVDFRDCTGTITGKKWDAKDSDNDIYVVGNVVLVAGIVTTYQQKPQLKISEGHVIPTEEIDTAKFMEKPPVAKEELVKKFNAFVESVKEENAKKLLDYFVNKFKDVLYDAPAARSIHHEYSSGLIMHEVTMAELAEKVAATYPNVNRDLLITGVLLHDLGKLVELQGPVVYNYTLEGKLVGHISIMVGMVKEAADELKLDHEFVTLITHMILSHHGQYDFGSPVLPQTLEAMILYMLDNLDSKIVIINKALQDVKKGEFTQKIFALDGRTLYKNNL